MEYRTIAGTDLRVSLLGFGNFVFGTNWWGDFSDDEGVRLQNRASFDLGVTFFDTAAAYGNGRAERLLAETIRYAGRDRVVVSTKFGYELLQRPPGTLATANVVRVLPRHLSGTTWRNLLSGWVSTRSTFTRPITSSCLSIATTCSTFLKNSSRRARSATGGLRWARRSAGKKKGWPPSISTTTRSSRPFSTCTNKIPGGNFVKPPSRSGEGR